MNLETKIEKIKAFERDVTGRNSLTPKAYKGFAKMAIQHNRLNDKAWLKKQLETQLRNAANFKKAALAREASGFKSEATEAQHQMIFKIRDKIPEVVSNGAEVVLQLQSGVFVYEVTIAKKQWQAIVKKSEKFSRWHLTISGQIGDITQVGFKLERADVSISNRESTILRRGLWSRN